MADPFSVLVANLHQLGFYGFILPFILMFAIVFGLLLKYKTLGEDKRLIGVMSLVVAFFVTGYLAAPLGVILSNLFGAAIVVLAAILIVVLFANMAGYETKALTDKKVMLAVLIIVAIVLFIASGALAIFNVGAIANNAAVAAIFIIAVMAVAIWLIGGGDK
ncbi:MAG: hypothetical protein ABIG30_03845 [Candidatus Aenigmatarchaeota archaeon]